MIFQPDSILPDGSPDEEGLRAMKAALRDLKVVIRKPREHPRRAEMMTMLGDARAAIDRINAPNK